MPSQFGGVAVAAPTASKFGGIPVSQPPPARRDSPMDAISGFLSGAASVFPAVANAVVHPLDTLRSGWEAQKAQYDKAIAAAGPAGDNQGDLAGFLQHAAGAALPIIGPMASDFLDAADHEDAHDLGHRLGQIVATKALPDATTGAAKLLVKAGVPSMLVDAAISPHATVAKTVVKIAGKMIADHLRKVAESETPESTSAPESAPSPAVQPPAPLIEIPQSYATRPDAIPSEYGLLPAIARSEYFRPLGSDAPINYSDLASEAQTAGPQPAPEPPAPAAPAPAPAPEPQTPALTSAQRIEDAAAEQAAHLQMQAEGIMWANRARKADRFAAYLKENDLAPTPPNLAYAAKALAEREVPSADTIDLIHDRMNYQPQAAEVAEKSRLADMLAPKPAETPAAPDLEQQLRDSIAGVTPDKLKAEGIALNGKVARAGLGLSNLDQGIFDKVVAGEIPHEQAATIGEMLPGRFADQKAVLDSVQKAAARGKDMTPAQIAESIRVGMRPGSEITETQDSLFGSHAETRSLFAETGELSDYIRKQLASEKRLFGTVASNAAAERLGGAGNVINAAENSRIAGETTQAQAVYDKLSGMSGPVSDAIANGARELATGKDVNAIKSSTYEAVRRAISETLSGKTDGVPEGLPPGDSGGIGKAAGPAPGSEKVSPQKVSPPEVTPKIKKRIRRIGDLGKLGGE